MMKMVVIEDELRLCHGIAFHIQWEKYDIDVVGVAYDGKSGTRLIKEKQPDIVITDIRMPNMSGLEMIEEIHKELACTRFIIISGYDDFQYAQQAMALGVTHYVIKPTGEDRLIQEVLKVKEEILAESREKQHLDLLEQKWQEYLPRLQEQFFQYWLTQQYTAAELLDQAQRLQLPIRKNQYYMIAVFHIDNYTSNDTSNETSKHASNYTSNDTSNDTSNYTLNDTLNGESKLNRQVCNFSLLNCINGNEHAEHYKAFTAPHGSTVVIFWSEKGEEKSPFIQRTNQLISHWLVLIQRSLGITASAGIGRCIKAKEKLRISFEQAKSALMSRDYFGHNVAISYEEEASQQELFKIEPSVEKKLNIGLETLDDEKTIEVLEHYMNNGPSEASASTYIQEKMFYLATFFVRYIQSKGWFVQKVLGASVSWLYNAEKWKTKEQLVQVLAEVVKQITGYASKRQHASRNQIIQMTLNKIDEKLYTEISLQDLAAEVFVNSSYLSRLFKREIGQSFSSYVTERKMLAAKNLMYKGWKVHDVSVKLAYRDVSYFTKVFRKYWGITPKEMMHQQERPPLSI